jgi:hypothetical protein
MGMIAPDGPDVGANRSTFDVYDPGVEGQDVEITGVPNGRYCLSFVANPEGRIVETTTQNNGASRLIDVGTGPGGRTVSVGAAFDDSGTCGLTTSPGAPGAVPDPAPAGGDPAGPSGDTPAAGGLGSSPLSDPASSGPTIPTGTRRAPLLTMRKAAQLTRTALHQKFRSPKHLSRACRLTAAQHASCKVSLQQSGARYRGTVGVKEVLGAGEWRWFYAIDVKRTRKAGCRTCPARVRTKTLLGGVLGVNDAAAARVLSLPAGRPAAVRPGTAWPESRLCHIGRAQIAQRKPVG